MACCASGFIERVLGDIVYPSKWCQHVCINFTGVVVKGKTIAIGIVGFVVALFLSGIIHNTVYPEKTALPSPTPDSVRKEMQAQVDTDAAATKAIERSKAEKMVALGVVSKTYDAMRDQQSMTVSSLGVIDKPEAMTACLAYAAKNGFGGIDRGTAVWQLKKGGVFKFAIDNNALWNKECGNKESDDYTSVGRYVLEELQKKG